MCGLVKVHKMVTDGFPSFGPILSAIGPPTYKFAKFLFPVQGPYQLMSILLKIPSYLAEELVMASFDTESLFTNIHLQETIVKKNNNQETNLYVSCLPEP